MLRGVAFAILCSQPGFRRAGIAHPARAEYAPDHFSEEQLEAMAAEPKLELLLLDMAGRTGEEGPLAPVDPPAAPDAAPAAAPEAEPIKGAEEGPVSSEGQAATPGDAEPAADEAAGEDKAGEAAGASTTSRRQRGKSA